MNAAIVSEGDEKPESNLTFELKDGHIATIAHWIARDPKANRDGPRPPIPNLLGSYAARRATFTGSGRPPLRVLPAPCSRGGAAGFLCRRDGAPGAVALSPECDAPAVSG